MQGNNSEKRINKQVQRAEYTSAAEPAGAAMPLQQQKEKITAGVAIELEKGEKSGFIQQFCRKKFVKNLHMKYMGSGLHNQYQSRKNNEKSGPDFS